LNALNWAEVLAEICVMDAPLWRRLEVYVEKQIAFGSPFASASQRLAARLKAGDIGRGAPETGGVMPDFLLPDQRGRLVALGELTEKGSVVVSFNRGHWCPFCTIELSALAEAHAEFEGLGATIVSIMPDRQAYVGRLPRNVVTKLMILSDIDNAYTASLGLAFWLGDELRGLMSDVGLSLDEVQGNDSWVVPLPATFVLDRDARVVARTIEPDIRKRMDIDAIRRSLSGIRSR
jgi:peroxiredoxin